MWSELLYSSSGRNCNVAICAETWITPASGSRVSSSGGGGLSWRGISFPG